MFTLMICPVFFLSITWKRFFAWARPEIMVENLEKISGTVLQTGGAALGNEFEFATLCQIMTWVEQALALGRALPDTQDPNRAPAEN